MVLLNSEKLVLPLLGHDADEWKLCGGKLEYGRRAGCLRFIERGLTRERRVYGPIFDCRDVGVWETGEGSAADLLLLGRDLGLRRHEHYLGHGLVGYVAPKWGDALRAYMPAIWDGDADALDEAIDLIELPAKGVMAQMDERAVIRLRRELRNAPDRDAHDRILETLLEHLRL
jgi:hypothetical protein